MFSWFSNETWPPDVTVSGGDGWTVQVVWSRSQLGSSYGIRRSFVVGYRDPEFYVTHVDYARKFVAIYAKDGDGDYGMSRSKIAGHVAAAAEHYIRAHLAQDIEAEKRQYDHGVMTDAYQREADRRQAFATLVNADLDRIAAELRAGRAASLRISGNEDWQQLLFRGAAERIESFKHRIALEVEAAAQQREADRIQARVQRLEQPMPLQMQAGNVVFCSQVDTGNEWAIPYRQLQHILICGVSGSGKSVLLHSLCYQFAEAAEVERLVLIDLKGGLEFERYTDRGNVQVVWEFDQVCEVIEGLMQLMIERQDYMRANRQQNRAGVKTIVVIDEYAELQTEIDAAGEKEAKAKAKRFASSMVSLSRRARALGIVLVCALQKATTDAMDSSLRSNLGYRLVLRTANKLTASSMLELGDDLDSLSVSPTRLPTGRYYFYDPSRGPPKLLQAQIAPGVQLDW